MRSAIHDTLPPALRRSLVKFGRDLGLARRKRRLTVAMMAERLGVAKSTYLRVEKGDASVAMGMYAMALWALGFGNAIGELVDPGGDIAGLLMDEERVPKRIRPTKTPTPL